MTHNTVRAYNGTEIYEDKIYEVADSYIETLLHREDIEKPNVFTGLIKYINRHMGFDRSIYDSLDTLNSIWCSYTDLVYKYNQKPTIEEYALLIGISRDTIYSWMNGETRKDDYSEKLCSSRSDTIKKWQEECKIGRYKSAASGNVGGIFLCKAVDGMVETAPIPVQNAQQVQSLEEIRQRYGAIPDNESHLGLPQAEF